MKNKILLTTAMALIGLLTFSTIAEAHHGRGGRNRHKHVFWRHGNRVVVWHNNYRQCGNGWNFNNRCNWNNGFRNNRMCTHMRNIYRGGRCGTNVAIRCNSRGCGMFGMSWRNGRFFDNHRDRGYRNGRGNRGRRYYNRGGGRGNGRGYDGRRGRGNGRGHGRGR